MPKFCYLPEAKSVALIVGPELVESRSSQALGGRPSLGGRSMNRRVRKSGGLVPGATCSDAFLYPSHRRTPSSLASRFAIILVHSIC